MAELQTIQQPPVNQEEADAPDTEEEFKTLYTDAKEGQSRFEALAASADKAGHPEIAKVYREISGTVLSLLADALTSTAGAIIGVEDELAALPGGGGGGGSMLLQEDADKYLSLFDQYLRLLDGLANLVPEGEDGDKQRAIFDTLRRMTDGMIEYTKSIVGEPEDDDDDDEEDDDEEDDEE